MSESGYDMYLKYQYRWTGDFYTTLIQAIQLADTQNLCRLTQGFPELVDAYKVWSREGAQALLEKVSPDHPLRDRLINNYKLEDK